jgi:hypothetical protein
VSSTLEQLTKLTLLEDVYSQLDIDDLHDPEASNGIILEMQDRERYFEGRMCNDAQSTNPVRKIQTFALLILKYLLLEIRSIFSISRCKIKFRVLGYSTNTSALIHD